MQRDRSSPRAFACHGLIIFAHPARGSLRFPVLGMAAELEAGHFISLERESMYSDLSFLWFPFFPFLSAHSVGV